MGACAAFQETLSRRPLEHGLGIKRAVWANTKRALPSKRECGHWTPRPPAV